MYQKGKACGLATAFGRGAFLVTNTNERPSVGDSIITLVTIRVAKSREPASQAREEGLGNFNKMRKVVEKNVFPHFTIILSTCICQIQVKFLRFAII